MSDSISRHVAIEAVRAMQTYKLVEGDDMILVDKVEVQTMLMLLPKTEPKTGKWIVHDHGVTYWYKCDRCGGAGDKEDKFCKHCGAKMEGENHDNKKSYWCVLRWETFLV